MNIKSLKHKLAYIALGGMIAVCGMVSATFLSITDAQNGDATFENIKATHLAIVGDDGETRIRLIGSIDGAHGKSGLVFQDKSGKTRILIAFTEETSAINLAPPGIGKNSVSIATIGTGGALVISDTDGKTAATVHGNDDGGVVTVKDSVGGDNHLD